MRGVAPGKPVRRVHQAFAHRLLAVSVIAGGLSACATVEIAPAHLMPLSKETLALLNKKHMEAKAPIFIRIYKEESQLEVWKLRDDGRFYHLKTFPICNWSGKLGPKVHEGDMQSPEGFYTLTKEQLNPNSRYHLAFNLGYPNLYDKSNRHTGDALMIHGGCGSSGCYAMTDALMEELYALVREAMDGGQTVVNVHLMPFRMTKENMARHAKSEWAGFWRTLKQGYDYFELTHQVPTVAVCNHRYVVNVKMLNGGDPARLNPTAACPAFLHPKPRPFRPLPGEQASAGSVTAPGAGIGRPASSEADGPRMGLTKAPQAAPDWWQRLLSLPNGLGSR